MLGTQDKEALREGGKRKREGDKGEWKEKVKREEEEEKDVMVAAEETEPSPNTSICRNNVISQTHNRSRV